MKKKSSLVGVQETEYHGEKPKTQVNLGVIMTAPASSSTGYKRSLEDSLMLLGRGDGPSITYAWGNILSAYRIELGLKEDSTTLKQFRAYAEGKCPAIADPVIKAIPIYEGNEPLVNIRQQVSSRVTMIPDPSKPYEGADFNAGFPESSKIRETLYQKLLHATDELDKIAHHFGYKPEQIDIKVFEAFRSVESQDMIYNAVKKEIMDAHPGMSEETAIVHTNKIVSPTKDNIPVHSTGAAVDIRLWDNINNCYVDMGGFGASPKWSKPELAATFSEDEDLKNEHKENRLFLMAAFEKAGLTNYPFEWWHWSSGDRYAAYWTNESAIYGGVKA